MKILVANLGSTSFKYRLFAMEGTEERLLARGGFERVSDFGEVIEAALLELEEAGHLSGRDDLDAVGFKTVLGKDLSGCVEADERVLGALRGLESIAPAHNTAYAAGIEQFRRLTQARLVALFETSFYQWLPEPARRYAVPESWYEAGIRRYGFHGASHKFIAERSAEFLGRDDVATRVRGLYRDGPGAEPEGRPLRLVSCHLGGSSSVSGIRNGVAVGTSMGLSPQSGLPQNNRVGDLDAMALPLAMEQLGLEMPEALRQLTMESGLLGLSGQSNDLRDVSAGAAAGNERCRLAVDFLIASIRHWIGAFAFQMGGLEAIVFTAGIGENRADIREGACAGLEAFGIRLDKEKNESAREGERDLSAPDSSVKILVLPTNEELVVARETRRL
ncbi:MAG: acetate kinase, partial [Verrucomicrobia bacterium]|nr:acetate kinase [Verrucomicrobiota bacterium]